MIKSLEINERLEKYISDHSYDLHPIQKMILNKWKAKPNAKIPEYIENRRNFSFCPFSLANTSDNNPKMINATKDED